jgi:flagellar biosynthesis protein FlhG
LSDFQRAHLINLFEQLEGSADFLIIDASAGLSANVLSFAAAADDVLVVTTPEPPAITDAYAVIKVLLTERHVSNILLVVNMAKNISQVRSVHSRIANAARRFLGFDLSLAGFVLSDRHVRLAVSSRRPFVWSFPHCRAARGVQRLAKHLLRLDRLTCPEPRRGTCPGPAGEEHPDYAGSTFLARTVNCFG